MENILNSAWCLVLCFIVDSYSDGVTFQSSRSRRRRMVIGAGRQCLPYFTLSFSYIFIQLHNVSACYIKKNSKRGMPLLYRCDLLTTTYQRDIITRQQQSSTGSSRHGHDYIKTGKGGDRQVQTITSCVYRSWTPSLRWCRGGRVA